MPPGKFKGNTTYGPTAIPQRAPEGRGNLTVRQAIHAAIEDSAEGSLTTKQIVNFIRLTFGDLEFAESTVSHYLSYYCEFQKIKTQGERDCRWALAGTCNGIKTLRTPTQFKRISTPITHAYLNSGVGKFTLLDACHAVLNASSKGSFPTGEMEDRIRTSYPNLDFARSTLASTLSREGDFRQYFPHGKGPGRWFLTGIIRGIDWTETIQTTESCGTPHSPLPSGDSSVTTDDENPPAADLPYNNKTEEIEAQSPDPALPSPNFSSPLLPDLNFGSDQPPRAGGAVGPCRGTGRPTSRYQPYSTTKLPKKHKHADLAIQLGTTVPLLNTTSSFDLNNCNTEELAGKLDALQLSPLPTPAPCFSTSQPSSDVPLTLPHAPASFCSWSPNGAETYGLAAPYQGDLGFNNADHTSYLGSFSDGSCPVANLLQDLADVNGNMAPKTGYPIMTAEQQILHNEWPQVTSQAYEEIYAPHLESHPHGPNRLLLGDKNPFDQIPGYPDVFGAGFPVDITF